MIEVVGDFWQYPANWRVIPTNGMIYKAVGEQRLIMGKGLALDAKKRYPGIDRELGGLVAEGGNKPYHCLCANDCAVFSFPTKYNWRHPSNLALIERSAKSLRAIYDEWGTQNPIVLFPHVGCGVRTGQLKWEQVKPILDQYFPEPNFVAISQDDYA